MPQELGTPLHDCGAGPAAPAVATGGATLSELKQHAPDWAVEDLRHLSAREICRR